MNPEVEGQMAGYRIASHHPRETWAERLVEVPEQLREAARRYLRWAWARDTSDDFEVHP